MENNIQTKTKTKLQVVTGLLEQKKSEMILKIENAKSLDISGIETFLKQTDFKEVESLRKNFTEKLDEVKKNLMVYEKEILEAKNSLEKKLIELKKIEKKKVDEANEKIKREAAALAAESEKAREIDLFLEKRKMDFFNYCVKQNITVGQLFVEENFNKICKNLEISAEQKQNNLKIWHDYFSTFEFRKQNLEIELQAAEAAREAAEQKAAAEREAAALAASAVPELKSEFKELKTKIEIEIENTPEFGIKFVKFWLQNFAAVQENLRGENFANVTVARVCAAIVKSGVENDFKKIQHDKL